MMDDVLSPLLALYDLGGPVVLLLCGLSVIVLSVVLYKLWQFAAAGVGKHHHLHLAATDWDQGKRDDALRHLEKSSSYLAAVMRMAVAGEAEFSRLEAEAETRFARLERGFRLLDSVAQLAPLLGLFGTVLGMITAFQSLQEAGAQVDPSILAGGIWVALLTTAVGLAVAMPTAVLLSVLESRMDADRVFAQKAIQMFLAPRSDIRHVTAPIRHHAHA